MKRWMHRRKAGRHGGVWQHGSFAEWKRGSGVYGHIWRVCAGIVLTLPVPDRVMEPVTASGCGNDGIHGIIYHV